MILICLTLHLKHMTFIVVSHCEKHRNKGGISHSTLKIQYFLAFHLTYMLAAAIV